MSVSDKIVERRDKVRLRVGVFLVEESITSFYRDLKSSS